MPVPQPQPQFLSQSFMSGYIYVPCLHSIQKDMSSVLRIPTVLGDCLHDYTPADAPTHPAWQHRGPDPSFSCTTCNHRSWYSVIDDLASWIHGPAWSPELSSVVLLSSVLENQITSCPTTSSFIFATCPVGDVPTSNLFGTSIKKSFFAHVCPLLLLLSQCPSASLYGPAWGCIPSSWGQ